MSLSCQSHYALINCMTHPTTPGNGASRVRHVLGKSDVGVRQSTALVRQGSRDRCVNVHFLLFNFSSGTSTCIVNTNILFKKQLLITEYTYLLIKFDRFPPYLERYFVWKKFWNSVGSDCPKINMSYRVVQHFRAAIESRPGPHAYRSVVVTSYDHLHNLAQNHWTITLNACSCYQVWRN